MGVAHRGSYDGRRIYHRCGVFCSRGYFVDGGQVMSFYTALAYLELFATLTWVVVGAAVVHLNGWSSTLFKPWMAISAFGLFVAFTVLFSGVIQ